MRSLRMEWIADSAVSGIHRLLYEHRSGGAINGDLLAGGDALGRTRDADNRRDAILASDDSPVRHGPTHLYDPRVAQRDCCRAKSDLRSESCSKPEAQSARDGRNRRTERKKGGREQELRNSQEKRP